MKPVIGVIPLYDYEKESQWMLPGYQEGIQQGGGLPIVLPLTTDPSLIGQAAGLCDGFLFTGGQDVSPSLYGEERLSVCGECCPERDRMEVQLLRHAVSCNKPVLGICRGIQFINAALGGTLYQDLPAQHPSEIEHHQTPPYDKIAHSVLLPEHTPLRYLLNTEKIPVNSYHHQAVKKLAPCLKTMAVSDDGLIEGIYHPGKSFLWAVQWHPEFNYKTDENSRKIFRKFVEAAGKNKYINM